jgi:hypothetical protein
MRLDIEFHDGHVGAIADTGETPRRDPSPSAGSAARSASAERPKPKRRAGGEGQGSLFGA